MNTCIKCGCQEAYPSLPPCPTPEACPNPQPCSEAFDAQCIAYTLPDIKCGLDIVVAEDSNVAQALTSIVLYLCTKLATKVHSVTGLNTNNADPLNPVVRISVDGTTITGLGTPASPLIATSFPYTLPIASPTVLGGIKIGSGLTINGSGVLSTTSSITGSGINNYVTRWTPDGTTLGTGKIRDDNSTVGINAAPVSYAMLNVDGGTKNIGIESRGGGTLTSNSETLRGVYGYVATPNTFGLHAGVFGQADGNQRENMGGYFAAQGTTIGTNYGLIGTSSAGAINVGIYGTTSTGANSYAAQLKDGTEGIGKVLTCMTSDGKANWETTNKQKEITTSNYILTNIDNDYTIFINNGVTAISISLGAITVANFCVGFIQEGSADVTFVGVTNPVGLKLKGQGYQAFIERKLSTATYYLLGNTKV